jgi:hypothetical protein
MTIIIIADEALATGTARLTWCFTRRRNIHEFGDRLIVLRNPKFLIGKKLGDELG